VVEHDGHRKAQQPLLLLGDLVRVREMQLHMPAHRRDLRRQRVDGIESAVATHMRRDPDAAHSAFVQAAHLGHGRVGREPGDAACTVLAELRDHVQRERVVRAVHAGAHLHRAR
jgi:hypothetical protein